MAFKITDDCVKCLSCQDVCPVGAIVDDGDKLAIDADACLGCGACADACPIGAIVESED
ncbi:MAG: 4Fe-4S binding protein [Clostridia bacterium]|nr:4Fe-4S binding protein [Clostridia bacterium]